MHAVNGGEELRRQPPERFTIEPVAKKKFGFGVRSGTCAAQRDVNKVTLKVVARELAEDVFEAFIESFVERRRRKAQILDIEVQQFEITQIVGDGELVHPGLAAAAHADVLVEFQKDVVREQEMRPREEDFPVAVRGFRAAVEIRRQHELALGLEQVAGLLQHRVGMPEMFPDRVRIDEIEPANVRRILGAQVGHHAGDVRAVGRPFRPLRDVHPDDLAAEMLRQRGACLRAAAADLENAARLETDGLANSGNFLFRPVGEIGGGIARRLRNKRLAPVRLVEFQKERKIEFWKGRRHCTNHSQAREMRPAGRSERI